MADLDDLELQVSETEAVEAAAISFISAIPPPLDEVRLAELIARLDVSEKNLAEALGMGGGAPLSGGLAAVLQGQSGEFRFSYKGRPFVIIPS